MPLFVSVRERRLWLAVLAVAVAIYATLGLAQAWAGELRARGLLDALFGVAMLMVIAAAVLLAWRTRPSGLELGVWVGIAAAYLTAFVRISIPEERTHLIEYGVLALLVHEALRERRRHRRGLAPPAVLAVLLAAALGVVDELIQLVLPARVFDVRDILFNALAAFMAVAASAAVRRARRGPPRH